MENKYIFIRGELCTSKYDSLTHLDTQTYTLQQKYLKKYKITGERFLSYSD